MATIWGLPGQENPIDPIIFNNPVVVPSVAALAALKSFALVNNVQQIDTSAFYANGNAGGGSYIALPSDITSGCLFSGSIAGTTLNVASVTNGSILPGYALRNNGVAARTFVVAQLSGTPGGIGTYSVNVNQAVNAGPMTADDGASVIVSLTGMRWGLKYDQFIPATKFGVLFDFDINALTGTDNWGAYQAIWWFNNRTNIPVRLEAGDFAINGKININGVNVTGINIHGAGKFGTTLWQMHSTDPVHQLNSTSDAHSWNVGHFGINYTTAGSHATKPSRAFIYCPSTGNTDFYNNYWEEIFCDNIDYFIKSVGPSVWGHERIGVWLATNVTGGMANTIPDINTGQPNNSETGTYMGCTNMVGPVWAGSGTEQSLYNVEMNGAILGPQFITDSAGGVYNGSFNRMEVATYNLVPNLVIFDVLNGVLQFDAWEIGTLTITEPTFGFGFQPNRVDSSKVDLITTSFASISGAGAFYLSLGTLSGPSDVSSRLVIGDWVSSPVQNGTTIAATNNASSAGGIGLDILSWNDVTKVQYLADADFTILGNGPREYIYYDPVNTDRIVTAPDPFGNMVFEGMRRKVTKHDKTGTGTVTFLGKVIPADHEGEIEGVYCRNSTHSPVNTWIVCDFSTWT